MVQRATIQLKLGHRLIMTPSLQYAIRLLPMSKLELQDVVNTELSENPVLEDVPEAPEPEDGGEAAPDEGEGTEGEGTSGEGVAVGGEEGAEAVEEQELKATRETAPEEFDDDAIESFFSDYVDDTWRPPTPPVDLSDLPSFENTLSTRPTLSDHLTWQLDCTPCSDRIKEIGLALIGNLDEDGYMRVEQSEIASMGDYAIPEIEEALSLIQQFDPAGVGARTLQECLLIQIRLLGLAGTGTEALIRDHLDLVQARDHAALCQRLGCTQDELQGHLDIIRHLDPQPGLKYSGSQPFYVVPDVYVVKVDDDFVVALNDEGVPRLRVSPTYARMLRSGALREDAEGRKYLREHFKSALWLIKSLDQRQRTIHKVSLSIVRRQREFLEHGKDRLRPMVLRDVAAEIGVHESTVGRVVANKYMQTPLGIFSMKSFFNRGLNNESGESVSTSIIKQKIRDMVSAEPAGAPLSDSVIAARLRHEHLRIARRTVAKYRDELNIRSSHLRRTGGSTGSTDPVSETANDSNQARSGDKP